MRPPGFSTRCISTNARSTSPMIQDLDGGDGIKECGRIGQGEGAADLQVDVGDLRAGAAGCCDLVLTQIDCMGPAGRAKSFRNLPDEETAAAPDLQDGFTTGRGQAMKGRCAPGRIVGRARRGLLDMGKLPEYCISQLGRLDGCSAVKGGRAPGLHGRSPQHGADFPNSRLSFVQVSPPSVDRNICPRLVQQNSSIGSAALVATHHTVLLIVPGSRASSQLWPWSRLRQSRPSAPGGPLPLVMNRTPPWSARGITARVYCQADGSSNGSQLSPLSRLRCGPQSVVT